LYFLLIHKYKKWLYKKAINILSTDTLLHKSHAAYLRQGGYTCAKEGETPMHHKLPPSDCLSSFLYEAHYASKSWSSTSRNNIDDFLIASMLHQLRDKMISFL
jgi:hypothetical protein